MPAKVSRLEKLTDAAPRGKTIILSTSGKQKQLNLFINCSFIHCNLCFVSYYLTLYIFSYVIQKRRILLTISRFTRVGSNSFFNKIKSIWNIAKLNLASHQNSLHTMKHFSHFGEAYKLKWEMVAINDYDKKSKQTFVELDLPKAICKNRKSRKILCRGGQYFKRIKTYSNWVSPENYLFVNNSDGTPISKSEFCCLWHELMEVAESHELNLSIS